MGAEDPCVGDLMAVEIEKEKQKNILIFPALFAAVSLITSLGAAFYGVRIGQTLLFALYQTLGIFLPGMALYLLLLGGTGNMISFFCLSYALGYALTVLAYFPAALLGIGRGSVLTMQLLLTGAACIVLGRKKNSVEFRSPDGVDFPFLFVLISFLILSFLSYGGNYPLPSTSQPDISYHADALYWVENAAALTKSFPPQELRLSGSTLFYHYFASVYVAFANLITGIDCFSLSYSLYPLGKTLIVFGGFYELAGAFFPERKKRIFFLTALLFSTGFEYFTVANYVAQFLTLPFGFDLGFAFGAYFLAFLLRQSIPVREAIGRERLRRKIEDGLLPSETPFSPEPEKGRPAAAAALCILMCSGHKAPVALICLVFAAVICLRWLTGGEWKKALLNGIPAVACFVLVMVVCVGLFSGADSRVNAGGFSHVATLRATPLFDIYEETALSREPGFRGIVRTAFVFLLQTGKLVLMINPLVLFLVLHGLWVLLKKRSADHVDLALLLMLFAGLLMGLFNAQEGVSQMYYTLVSYLPGLLFGLRHMNVYLLHENPDGRNLTAALASGLLLMQIMLFMGPGAALECSWKGFANANSIRYHYKQSEEPKPYSLQLSDYEALVWIRDHTEPDSILAADRSVLCGLDNYMFYGTFSERQMYIEGDRYFYGALTDQRNEQRETTRMIFANSYGDLLKARDDGVDYILQTKWVSPYYIGLGCEKVFSTDTMNVWKING